MSYKVVGIGEVLWDIFPEGRKMGGAPANFAYHARVLGADARVISRVGDDPLGHEMISRFKELGLPADCGLSVDIARPTGTVEVDLAPDGQPCFTIREDVAWDHLVADSSSGAVVAEADAVCFGSLGQRCAVSREAIQRLLAASPYQALRIFDVNLRQDFYSRELIEQSLQAANVLKLNDAELPVVARLVGISGLSDKDQVCELAKRYHLRLVAYTCGARGSMLYDGADWTEHAVHTVAVKDTVGAGDSFTAAVTMGVLAGWDLQIIGDRASEIAAYVCSCDGATPPMPERLRAPFLNTTPFAICKLVAALLLLLTLVSSAAQPGHERYRPQFHFTPERNWMNDPNGMVFFEGEWHLFYQYNPFGDRWGHMSWGHAVSRDLVSWEHLPLALAEENGVMIFSGSAVVDWNNTSGFGREGKPPLVAIYTGDHNKRQDQRLAYSNDHGRTWTKYDGNPVLDMGMADFRDPKVFWHEPTQRWVMTVAPAQERKVNFYSSPNLKEWKQVGEFGPAGATGGQWECPDLFSLPSEGEAGASKWVLTVNINSGAPAGGSGCQYFVGEFDGARFVADAPQSSVAEQVSQGSALDNALWVDFGADFYAAVTWSDVPRSDGRRIWLAWMNNWQYAEAIPTSPWRSAMTVPRALSLRRTPNGLRLVQQPITELHKLRRGAPLRFIGGSFAEAATWLATRENLPSFLEIELAFAEVSGKAPFTLHLHTGKDEETSLTCDPLRQCLTLDRTRSGESAFHKSFPARHEMPVRFSDRRLALHLILDTSSLEVFAQGGESSLTDLIFPAAGPRQISLTADGIAPTVSSITIHALQAGP